LILPPSLNIAIAIGSVFAAVWNNFSRDENGTFNLYSTPIASGLIAGEAIMGSIILPLVAILLEFTKT
jgi:uncharacterized oligopeptide transporter (OPT) family protein